MKTMQIIHKNESITIAINKSKTGKFYATEVTTGNRFDGTNYGRMYDAIGLVKRAVRTYGASKVKQIIGGAQS